MKQALMNAEWTHLFADGVAIEYISWDAVILQRVEESKSEVKGDSPF